MELLIIFALLGALIGLYIKVKADKKIYEDSKSIIFNNFIELEQDFIELEQKHKKLLHQKKSSEVRLGKIGENLAPFTEYWPWDPNNFRFIGSPIDGIQFKDDEIIFVEIKTGKSRLSKYQTKCKELVEAGKIRFSTFRIDEGAVEIK